MLNPVLESTKKVIEFPIYVKINQKKLEETAEKFSKEKFEIPGWNMPIYPETADPKTPDFIFLENTINFAFTDFETKKKFATILEGTEWKGSSGMCACLKRAKDEGAPIFNSNFLENITEAQMKKIFKGNMEIPMLKERTKIFQEVGGVLNEKYKGSFHKLLEASEYRLFGIEEKRGLVERLIEDFPSFDDSRILGGEKICFNKRAQLLPAILYGKFQNTGSFKFPDITDLTIFADYVLPKGLRDLGILIYEKGLAKKVDTQQLLLPWGQEEMEIRASTIHAVHNLIELINKERKEKPINALHMDYRLWSESRKNGKTPHHLTKTIAY